MSNPTSYEKARVLAKALESVLFPERLGFAPHPDSVRHATVMLRQLRHSGYVLEKRP